MFNSVARILVVVLLALAVPLQGLAAAGIGICGTLHGAGGDIASGAVVGHAKDALGGDHAASMSIAAADSGLVADSGAGDTEGRTAHCAACAGCGAAAAIVSEPRALVPEPRGADVHAGFSLPRFGFAPNGIDRPPLTLPA